MKHETITESRAYVAALSTKVRLEVDYWLMVLNSVLFQSMTWDTAKHNAKLLVKGWRR